MGQSDGEPGRSLSAIRDRIARLKQAIEGVLDAGVLDVVSRLASELDSELRAERAALEALSGAIDLDAERAKRGQS